jgi:hypothetical protein
MTSEIFDIINYDVSGSLFYPTAIDTIFRLFFINIVFPAFGIDLVARRPPLSVSCHIPAFLRDGSQMTYHGAQRARTQWA